MVNRRYVVAYGDFLERDVYPAPEAESGEFLTRAEAAERIVREMDGAIAAARESRRRAVRILTEERKSGAWPVEVQP